MLSEKLASDIAVTTHTKLAGLDNYWINEVNSLEPIIEDKGIANLWGLLNRRIDPVIPEDATFTPITSVSVPQGSVENAAILMGNAQGFRGSTYEDLLSKLTGHAVLNRDYLSNHDVKEVAKKLLALKSSPIKGVSTREVQDLAKMFNTMGNANAALTSWT